MCVSVSPGNARITSFLTNSSEQIFTNSGVLRIVSAMPKLERMANTQVDRPKQRGSRTVP